MGRTFRVVVLAEDPLAREVFRDRVLEDESVSEVSTVGSAADLGGLLARDTSDALVWDLGMRPDRALDAAPDVLSKMPLVVALAVDGNAAADAKAAGVRAVISRDRDGPAIAAALHSLSAGLEVNDPRLVVSSIPAGRGRPLTGEDLTGREREVLGLLVEGHSNRAIAERLGISEHTAKFHVTAVMQKLGAQTRTEAVVRAARLGLVIL